MAGKTSKLTRLIYPIIKPAMANPAPRYKFGKRRARLCAICPQIIAGMPVRNAKQVSESIPRTKLVIARPWFGGTAWPGEVGGGGSEGTGAPPAAESNELSSGTAATLFHSAVP